jgi:hypothetical protein
VLSPRQRKRSAFSAWSVLGHFLLSDKQWDTLSQDGLACALLHFLLFNISSFWL